MNALNSAKPSRVINLAYFLGSDPREEGLPLVGDR
jgi:hypothetical protein